MRTLRKNTQVFWYAFYRGKQAILDDEGHFTGEYEITYSDPIQYRGNVSAGSGSIHTQLFGVNWTFDRVMIIDDPKFPIDDSSVLWIDKTPEDGPHDYVVKRISRGLNQMTIGVGRVHTSE